MTLEILWTFSLKAHYYPEYHTGEDCSDRTVPTLWSSLYENVLQRGQFYNLLWKEARASIVLNIEWVQFVLQNWENLHSVRGLYDNKKKTAPPCLPQMWCIKSIKGSLTRHQICWQDFISKINLSNTKICPDYLFWPSILYKVMQPINFNL